MTNDSKLVVNNHDFLGSLVEFTATAMILSFFRRLEEAVNVAAVVLPGKEGRLPVIAALDDVAPERQQTEVGLGVSRKEGSLLIQIHPATPTMH